MVMFRTQRQSTSSNIFPTRHADRKSSNGIPGIVISFSVLKTIFQVNLELRMMEVVVTTGAIRCAKLQ